MHRISLQLQHVPIIAMVVTVDVVSCQILKLLTMLTLTYCDLFGPNTTAVWS